MQHQANVQGNARCHQIEFFFMIGVPSSIIEFNVKPLRDVWCLASDHLNTTALLLTMGDPIQDVGLID